MSRGGSGARPPEGVLRRATRLAAGRPRLALAGIGSLGAAAAAIMARRRQQERVRLPDPGPLASVTAVSVHNAAKGTVIAAIREAHRPDGDLLASTAHRAVAEAAEAGADLTAAAIGAVEGAMEVAHLLEGSPATAASRAASATVEGAGSSGALARTRVREALTPYIAQGS